MLKGAAGFHAEIVSIAALGQTFTSADFESPKGNEGGCVHNAQTHITNLVDMHGGKDSCNANSWKTKGKVINPYVTVANGEPLTGR